MSTSTAVFRCDFEKGEVRAFLLRLLLGASFLGVGSLLGLSGGVAIASELALSESGESELGESKSGESKSKMELDDLRRAIAISNDNELVEPVDLKLEQPDALAPDLASDLTSDQSPVTLQNNDFRPSEDLAQVTSVSELSDVQPGDWAYTALQRLVEEYGCLEGYPDNTFRGNRALTRYEFAAGLNACLDIVIFPLPSDRSNSEEIRRLQEEFAAELAMVRADVDTLEADVAQLEANQFSTTTKFSAQLFTHLNFATSSGDIKAEGINVFVPARDPVTNQPVVRTLTEDPEPTFSYYTWLNFTTSFTGKDRLQLQLTSGDGNGAGNYYGSAGLFNTTGVPFTLQTGTIGEDNVIVREVFYSFPVGEKLSFTIGPAVNWYRHFDNNRYTFYLTGANSFNSSGSTQVNAVDRGAGAVAELDITDWLDFRLGYLAENDEFLPGPRSSTTNGLFAGTTTLTGQLGIRPTDDINLRLLYTRSNQEPTAAGFVGGTIGEPITGFADDGFGGPLRTATSDTFLFNFDWAISNGFGLFGRYAYGSTNLFPVSDALPDGEVNSQSVQVGVAFPNLFREGAQGIISYVRPFDIVDGREFLASGGGDGGKQQEIEVAYRYPISQNIALVPSVYWIDNVNNFSDNPDLYIFNLQAQLSF